MSKADSKPAGKAVPLPSLMAKLTNDRSTGVLAVVDDDARREILFVKGEIRAARSDVEEEKLGMWLVRRERISEDDRALTLLSQGGGDAPPLGHLLVTRGTIERDELEEELQELTLAIVRRATAAQLVSCDFEEGGDQDQPDTLPDLFTAQIILVAARACEDLEAMRLEVGSQDRMALPVSDLQHLLDDLNLTPTEGFLLSRLDGNQTISNLFQLAALTEDQAIPILYSLMVAGIVKLVDPKSIEPSADATAGHIAEMEAAVDAVDETQLTDRQVQDRHNIRRMAEEVTRSDHYRALGQRPGIPPEDIKKAWKKYEKRFSPDRTDEAHLRDLGPQLEAILERAREAHEVLSTVRDRRRYDRILKQVEEERERVTGEGERGETDAAARSELVEANVKRADELIHDGELYLAIQLLEQACALDPRPPELIKLARLLLRNPLWTNRALSCMRRAIQVDPKYVDAWLELALFWRRRRNPERERKSLEKALATTPDHPRAKQMYRELMGKRELDRLLRRATHGRA